MNTNEIRKFYEVIKDNSQLTEIRILDGKKIYSGYFSSAEDIIKAIEGFNSYNIYFTLNRINDACEGRSQVNKITLSYKATTSDNDIINRDWILIDLDPKRPSDTNSTDEEKKNVQDMVNRIYSYLKSVGFASPIIADSSNGYHLLYKVAMNNTPENTTLVKQFLNAISLMFSTDKVEVDTSVFNASRICKLYGTTSRKGTNTALRPQRESNILRIPKEVKITPKKLIEEVVNIIPKPEVPSYKNNYKATFDIDEFIHRNSIQIEKEVSTGGARKILLKECPFDSNHKSPDSAIFVLNNGAIGFRCFHNSCTHHTWADLREMYEPKPQYVTNRSIQPPTLPQTEDKRGSKFLNLGEIESIDRSKIISIPSEIEELDRKIIGFNLGEVSVWSGNNASGKSTILGQLALNAIEARFKTALFSGELTASRVKMWLHLQAAGRQYTQKSNFADAYYTPKAVGELIDQWTENKLLIYNNDYGKKALNLLADLEEVIKKGVNNIILDNLMAIDIFNLDGDKYGKQTSFVTKLTDLAKDKQVHIHLVAHPRKTTTFLRKGDIAGTGDISNLVDNVFIVHRVNNDFRAHARDFFTDEVASQYYRFSNVVEVCKNRDLGVMDYLVGLYFEAESKRFLNFEYENINYGWIPREQPIDFSQNNDFDLPE